VQNGLHPLAIYIKLQIVFEVAMAGAVITRVSSVEQETKQSRPYRQCAQGSQCVCVCVCG